MLIASCLTKPKDDQLKQQEASNNKQDQQEWHNNYSTLFQPILHDISILTGQYKQDNHTDSK